MNILISNDDGYQSVGLQVLKDALSKYGIVYSSAPDSEKSGASCSIKFDYINPTIIDDKNIYFNCPPASCVEFGIKYYKDIDFDLVVTGINNGYNGSMYSIMSGTFGASLMASFIKPNIKCIIMSADINEPFLKEKANNVINYIISNNLLDICNIISVNLAPKEFDKEIGFKLGKMYNSYNHELHEDEDYYLLSLGFTTLTPIKNSLMDEEKFEELNKIL